MLRGEWSQESPNESGDEGNKNKLKLKLKLDFLSLFFPLFNESRVGPSVGLLTISIILPRKVKRCSCEGNINKYKIKQTTLNKKMAPRKKYQPKCKCLSDALHQPFSTNTETIRTQNYKTKINFIQFHLYARTDVGGPSSRADFLFFLSLSLSLSISLIVCENWNRNWLMLKIMFYEPMHLIIIGHDNWTASTRYSEEREGGRKRKVKE